MTTVSVPDEVLSRAMRAAQAGSAEVVVVRALEEYAEHRPSRRLLNHMGKSDTFMSAEELLELRNTQTSTSTC